MNNDELETGFASVSREATLQIVLEQMGAPTHQEEGRIPSDSGVGMQSVFWIKLRPDEPYLQLIYEGIGRNFYFWFAHVDDNWKIAGKLRLNKQ